MKSWTKKSVFMSSACTWTRSLAWQDGILITILPRNYMFRFLCGPSFTKCGFEQNPEVKNIIHLLGGELSFGLQRERRGCSPLYYRGTALVYRLRTIFHQVSRGISKSNAEPKKVYSSPRRGIEPVSRVMGDRFEFAAEERNTLFLIQHLIWKYLWKLGEKWYANDILTQSLGNIVMRIPACNPGDRNSIPCRGEEWSFLLQDFIQNHIWWKTVHKEF